MKLIKLNWLLPHQFEVIAAGVAVAATVASSAISAAGASDAAKTAADAQNSASQNSERLANQSLIGMKEGRDNSISYQQPYSKIGMNAQNRLSYLMGLGNTNYEPATVKDGAYDPATYTFGQFKVAQKAKLDALMAQRPNGSDKKSLAQWKKQKQALDASMKSRNKNQAFSTWQTQQVKAAQAQPGAVAGSQTPIDDSYGSLAKDAPAFDFKADPGYQFRVEQGQKALDRKLAAMGMSGSGAAAKESERFNAGEADQTYGQAWNRYLDSTNIFNQNKNNLYSRLSGLSSAGQAANNNISATYENYGNNQATVLNNLGSQQNQNITGAGNAKAAGQLGSSQAWAQGVSSIGSIAGGYAGGGYGGLISNSPTPTSSGSGGNGVVYNNNLSRSMQNSGWGS